jgi:cell division septation protein DedD
VSPILTRPVREQLEHDRVIRQLQARYKRKNEVIINPGNEQNQSITVGELVVYPDLLLFAEGGRRLLGTVEVETGESVNSIEARAEWGVYSKVKVPLHLYVPPLSVDAAKRICAEYQIPVAELWTYTTSFDQVRFTMVHRSPDAPVAKVTIKPSKPASLPKAQKPEAPPKALKKAAPQKAKAVKAKPKPKAKPAAVKKAKPAPKLKAKKGAKKRR